MYTKEYACIQQFTHVYFNNIKNNNMSTRVVSFRMTEEEYDKMMVECYQRGIGCAEWVQQKIAYSKCQNETLKKIILKLKSIRRILIFKKDEVEIKFVVENLQDIINEIS